MQRLSLLDSDEADKGRRVATLQFEIEDYLNLEKTWCSLPFYARNVPWRIIVKPKESYGSKCVGVFLRCNTEKTKTNNWYCYAIVKIRLMSFDPEWEPYEIDFTHVYCRDEHTWGCATLYRHIEPHYIRDGVISVEVVLTAGEAKMMSATNNTIIPEIVGIINQNQKDYETLQDLIESVDESAKIHYEILETLEEKVSEHDEKHCEAQDETMQLLKIQTDRLEKLESTVEAQTKKVQSLTEELQMAKNERDALRKIIQDMQHKLDSLCGTPLETVKRKKTT